MLIDKNYKGLIDEGIKYRIEGDLKTDESLEINLDKWLYVSGCIKAGEGIKAGLGIKAGFSITCKLLLKFGIKIFAGICTWRQISDAEKTITCGKCEGRVEYGILKELGMPKEDVGLHGKHVTVMLDGKEYVAVVE